MKGWAGWVGGLALVWAGAGVEAGSLKPGSVAVIAYNTSGSVDRFAWVALESIPAGSRLCFTDASVSNDTFRWSEHLNAQGGGPLTWCHQEAVPAGTVVRVQVEGGATNWSLGSMGGRLPLLSEDGDQLFVYEGQVLERDGRGVCTEARLLYGLDFANAGWLTNGSETASASYVPWDLAGGACAAAWAGRWDNGYYAGPVTGTVRQIQEWLAQPVFWKGRNGVVWSGEEWAVSFQVAAPSSGLMVSIW